MRDVRDEPQLRGEAAPRDDARPLTFRELAEVYSIATPTSAPRRRSERSATDSLARSPPMATFRWPRWRDGRRPGRLPRNVARALRPRRDASAPPDLRRCRALWLHRVEP